MEILPLNLICWSITIYFKLKSFQWMCFTERIVNEFHPISRNPFYVHQSMTCWASEHFNYLWRTINQSNWLTIEAQCDSCLSSYTALGELQLYDLRSDHKRAAWQLWWRDWEEREMDRREIFHWEKTHFDQWDETNQRFGGELLTANEGQSEQGGDDLRNNLLNEKIHSLQFAYYSS